MIKLKIDKYKQKKPFTCLPACITTILQYYGLNISEEEIAEKCETDLLGTKPGDVEKAMDYFDMNSAVVKGDISLVTSYLGMEIPLVVFLKVSELPYGRGSGIHAVVLCGLTKTSVICMDPALGKFVELPILDFTEIWEKSGSNALVIWE